MLHGIITEIRNNIHGNSTVNPPISALGDKAKLLPDLLGEVILEQEGQAVFDAVELLRKGFIQQRQEQSKDNHQDLITAIESMPVEIVDRVIHAFSTFFHLANINEEQANQKLRAQLEEAGETWANSFLETITNFKEQGKSLEEVLKLISELNYYPTFTAHPTEAKRPCLLYTSDAADD